MILRDPAQGPRSEKRTLSGLLFQSAGLWKDQIQHPEAEELPAVREGAIFTKLFRRATAKWG